MLCYSPKTLFIGQQTIYLPVCTSTNTIASEMLLKNEATEGCVVLTDHQTQGRGQRGNTWEAEPDKNITLSLILKPVFLPIQQQFYLTITISLAVLDTVHYFAPESAKIKWPNDILAGDKKLAGILIENSINGHYLQHSVVGIGLNVNQKIFSHLQATSLANVTNSGFNKINVAEKLIEHLEVRYLQLKNNRLDKLKFEYLQHLYHYQSPHLFRINNQETEGIIVGISETGQLAVQIKDKLQFFNFKEITFL